MIKKKLRPTMLLIESLTSANQQSYTCVRACLLPIVSSAIVSMTSGLDGLCCRRVHDINQMKKKVMVGDKAERKEEKEIWR